MVRKNCPPNEVTFNTFICILCQKGLIQQAIMLIEQMSEHGCTVGVVTCNALINGFCVQGRIDSALELFNSLPCNPNTITYTTLLTGLCNAERFNDAAELIAEMLWKDCLLWTPSLIVSMLGDTGRSTTSQMRDGDRV
jgi:pentatricopeptide repeat protein